MALSATLSELETWVRQDADMQAPDDRVTSSECRNRINRSLAHLYDRLVLVDQEYFLRSVSTTSNHTGKYDIMNDFKTGVVRSFTSVSQAGTGYTDGEIVTLAQGTNATATGVVSVTAGAVTGLTITSAGSGYFDEAYTQAAFTQLGTTIGPGATILGPAINVGTKTYLVFQNTSFGLLEIDPVAQTWVARTAAVGGNVTYRAAYVPSTNAIYVAKSNGDIYKYDIATTTWTVYAAVAPSFAFISIFYDDATNQLFATDAALLASMYAIDPVTVVSASVTPLGLTARVRGGRSGFVYFEDVPATSIYEFDTTALTFAAVTPIASSPSDFLYVASANKFYMGLLPAAPIKALAYDVTTASAIDLTATINALPNYVYAQSYLGYDATQDGVYFSGFLTSPYVAKIDATTDVATEALAVSGAAGALGTYEVANGNVMAVVYSAGTPFSTGFEFYSNQSVNISTPDYIIVNLAGFGQGAQALVYIESDFYKCKGIWYSDAGGGTGPTATWFPLRRFQWEQQNALNQSANLGGSGALPLYRIMTQDGRDKALLSPDNAGGAFQLWYYPAPTRLLVDNDRFDGRAGWDDWIVKDVAIQLLMAEESIEQAAALKSIRDEIWERIQLHASDREASQPERIMDVTLLSRRYSRR